MCQEVQGFWGCVNRECQYMEYSQERKLLPQVALVISDSSTFTVHPTLYVPLCHCSYVPAMPRTLRSHFKIPQLSACIYLRQELKFIEDDLYCTILIIYHATGYSTSILRFNNTPNGARFGFRICQKTSAVWLIFTALIVEAGEGSTSGRRLHAALRGHTSGPECRRF